jgi:large-conductance mechanosensitive channel
VLEEPKECAVRGNVVHIVGIIIGAVFRKIVDSLVKDVNMRRINRAAPGPTLLAH